MIAMGLTNFFDDKNQNLEKSGVESYVNSVLRLLAYFLNYWSQDQTLNCNSSPFMYPEISLMLFNCSSTILSFPEELQVMHYCGAHTEAAEYCLSGLWVFIQTTSILSSLFTHNSVLVQKEYGTLLVINLL